MPAAIPVITPDVFTVAIAELLVVQVPPETVALNVVVDPTQIACVPESVPALGGFVTVPVAVKVSVVAPVEAILTEPETAPAAVVLAILR